MEKVNVALVGYGYWGKNLARVYHSCPLSNLHTICEMNEGQASKAKDAFPDTEVIADYNNVLNNSDISTVLIATPVSFHYELAKQAILAGKDVFIEKPMTQYSWESEELVSLAKEHGRIIMVDHTFLYTGAVKKIKEYISSGELGKLTYFDSVRVNLGLFQHDVNVVYDLAPHDLAILDYLVEQTPTSVMAMGKSHANNDIASLAYLHIEYPDNFIAHFHFNWMAPVKLRRTIIGGDKKMILFDDLEPSEKIKIYDKGIVVNSDTSHEDVSKLKIDYRVGDMVAPKLESLEALQVQALHFIDCIKERKQPISDGEQGMRVVKILDASLESINNGGVKVRL